MNAESLNANKVLVALLALIVKQGGQVSIPFHEYLDAGQHYSLRWEPTEQHNAAVLTAVRAEAPMDPGFRKITL